eukprot:gene1351-1706_t
MSDNNNYRDVRYFIDWLKNCNESREIQKVLTELIKVLETYETGNPNNATTDDDDPDSENIPIEELPNFNKISEFIEALWYKITNEIASYADNLFNQCFRIISKKLTETEFSPDHLKALYLNGIVKNTLDDTNQQEAIQWKSLEVSLKCFKSPSLEKRNAGLNDIIRFTKSDSNMFMMRNQYTYPFVSPVKIVEWIKENKVIEQLYGETMHIQLLQKCTDILKFLAEQKALERKYLDLIWNASEGKHETIENVIYETIGNIAGSLPNEDVDYLYDKVTEIPYSHYTVQTLNLIRSLTQKNSSDPHQVPRGLEMFWNIIQDQCTEVDFELTEAAFNYFREILISCQSQRLEYLNRCVKNLENHTTVVLSLRSIYQLFDQPIFPRKKQMSNFNNNNNNNIITNNTINININNNNNNNNNNMMQLEPDTSSIIEQIDNQYHIVDLVYKHLVHYNTECKKLVNTGKYMNFDDHALNDVNFFGKHPHRTHLFDCLHFLISIYERSRNISITKENIDVLWEVYVVNTITQVDTKFEFFNNFQKQRQQFQLNEQQFSYFLAKFKELPFSDIDITSVTFYIFCMTNLHHQLNENINPHHLHHQQQPQLTEIVGLDDLWRIVLEAQNEEVGKQAITFIIDFHKSIHRNPEEFLNTCLLKLSKVPTTQNGTLDPANNILVVRCLTLIKRYLEDFGPRISDSFKRHYAPQITITFTSQKHKFSQDVKSNETIGNLRYLVCQRIGAQSPQCINFFCQGRSLNEDFETLEDYKIYNGETISFQEIPEPRFTEPPPTFNINFDQSKFSLLFSLLNIDSVAQEVWDLLMLLPVNRQILQDITTLRTPVNWNSLLDPTSSYRLLYSLQIIESFLNPSLQESESDRNEWKNRFVTSGGVNHLMDILMKIDLQNESRGAKRNTCLSMLLRAITSLILIDSSISLSTITKIVNPSALLTRLIELTWNQTIKTVFDEETFSQHETENATVVSYLLQMIVGIISNSEELLDAFFNHADISKWISMVVLESKDTYIRERASFAISEICRNRVFSQKTMKFFLDQFLQLLFNQVENDRRSSTCSHFFSLLDKLLQDKCQNSPQPPSMLELSNLLKKLIVMVKTQPIVESTAIYQSDWVLIGLLNLIKTIITGNVELKYLAGHQEGLVGEIFHECLFNIATAENHGPTCPPKCKTKDSRDVAFSVLLELAKDCEENFRELFELLIEHHKPEEKRTLWSYYPQGNEKSTTGYVGLKNLGATCYINSLMQQLFMIPGFRYNIIQSEIPPQAIQDSILYQLKVIFANLQESEKKSHDTKEFCNTYKYEGQPINPLIQMDVDEFFNMLFDKLEFTLKGTPKEKLLNEYFGGANVNQFISQECPHVSEREEPFYTISLEVKNKKEIQESLQLYVESETLDGDNKYFCSQCSQKVKAHMRRCIKTLPNTLILHNKRFDFDLDLMKRTKLNDSFRFPMEIDMEPYTKEYLERKEAIEKAAKEGKPIPDIPPIHPPEYYHYELAGIIVHKGIADNGHYYSYIREREPLVEGQPRRWIFFNDQVTEVFNPDEIPKACFGGFDHVTMDQGKTNFRTAPRVYNAYMLFYERTYVEPYPNNTRFKDVKPCEASKLVPADLFNSVWKKNMKFLNDKNIFDGTYFNFLWNFLTLDQIRPLPNNGMMVEPKLQLQQYQQQLNDPSQFDQIMMCIELGTRFVIETLSHSKERKNLMDYVSYLSQLFERHIPGCYWLLETIVKDPIWIRQNFLVCITQDPRDAFSKLLLKVITTILPLERPHYGEYVDGEEEEEEDVDDDMMEDIVKPSESGAGASTVSGLASSVAAGGNIGIDEMEEDNNNAIVSSSQQSSSSSSNRGKQKAITQVVDDEDSFTDYSKSSKVPKSIIIKFMDTFLDYIKEAPSHWKHFTHYFMFIRDFSLLGHEERQYMVSRNVIGRLIDFFLGDESPVSKLHPPQKKTKMGDKYNSPQLSHMMEALSILIRSCKTRYMEQYNINDALPQSHSNDQPIPMPQEDVELLYNPIFINKSIREAVHPKSTMEIINHICYNDIETSANIIAMLETMDPNKFTLECLLNLILMDDSYKKQRIELAMRPYLMILDSNNIKLRGPISQFIKPLTDSATSDPQILMRWFSENYGEWVLKWLVESDFYEVRSEAYNLLLRICGFQDPQCDENVIINTFDFLLQSLKIVKRFQNPDEKTFRFEFYFKLMRYCIRVGQCHKAFLPFATAFYKFASTIFSHQHEMDRNRQELTMFIAELLERSPENVKAFQKDQITQKLMDFFISISPKDDMKTYNQRSLPSFYSIIYTNSLHDQDFLQTVAFHQNLDWAFKYLVIECPDYADTAKVLTSIAKLIVERVPSATSKLIQGVLSFEKVIVCPSSIIPFMTVLVTRKADVLTFCISRGFHHFNKLLIQKEPTDMILMVLEFYQKVLSLISKKSNKEPIDLDGQSSQHHQQYPQQQQQMHEEDVFKTKDIETLINCLFSLMEINEEIYKRAFDLFQLISCEVPEITLNTLSDCYTRRQNSKSQAQQHQLQLQLQHQSNNNNLDSHGDQLHHLRMQQPRLQNFTPHPQNIPPVLYYKSLIEIVNLCIKESSSQMEQKGSILLCKLTKEMIPHSIEQATQCLVKVLPKIKSEEKKSMITFALVNSSHLENPEFFGIIKKFFFEKENADFILGLCRELEEKINTSIASIQSIDNPSNPEVDTHFLILTNCLKQIELMGSCDDLDSSLKNIILALKQFASNDCCNIVSEKAKLFLTSFENLRISKQK